MTGTIRTWLIDSGASRHMCPLESIESTIRPSTVVVETANGIVRPLGEGTARVEALARSVDAVILEGTPNLLSLGSLIGEGYKFLWLSADDCWLVKPCGVAMKGDVTNRVPTLPARSDVTQGGANCKPTVATAGVVIEGESEKHRQRGHHPFKAECDSCVQGALRSSQHRRRPQPHKGVLAIDLAVFSREGPYVLVSATQAPGKAFAEPVKSRSANDLRTALLRILARARRFDVVDRVHCDRELGVSALEPDLLSLGCELSLTQGADPAANGIAENLVGRLCNLARAVLSHYDDAVRRTLWPRAMVWAAQRLHDPKLPPFGSAVLVRDPPAVKHGKCDYRAGRGVFLHQDLQTAGAICVGRLVGSAVDGVLNRTTFRIVTTEIGDWVFPEISAARLERRGRPRRQQLQAPEGVHRAPAGGDAVDEGHHDDVDEGHHDVDADTDTDDSGHDADTKDDANNDEGGDAGVLSDDNEPGPSHPGSSATKSQTVPEVEGPEEIEKTDAKKRRRESWADDIGASEDEGFDFWASCDICRGWRLLSDEVLIQSLKDDQQAPFCCEQIGAACDDGAAVFEEDNEPKRRRQEGHGVGPLSAFVTRDIPLNSEEASTEEAQDAMRKEMDNMKSKGTFDPNCVVDWEVEREKFPDALIGKAKMILGCKNAELEQIFWKYKGRLVFMGNNIRDAKNYRVLNTTDELYGTPVNLAVARHVLAVALLNDWGIESGDVDGAYLVADLQGPSVYLKLTPELWEACGVPANRLEKLGTPCLRVQKAMYGLPRAGFDWFAHCDSVLVDKLGWERVPGLDSVYKKADAMLAVYVDDLLLAGTAHARRREWNALREHIKLGDEPAPLKRFLGVRHQLQHVSVHGRKIRLDQSEYIGKMIATYNAKAAHPAGRRAVPSVRRREVRDSPGRMAPTCRMHVGSSMYAVRATRPDAAFSVNKLARSVSSWGETNDFDLEQLVSYFNATKDIGLEMYADVRDRKEEVKLELWTDADHAGSEDRKSTGGWVLRLTGPNGTNILLDWGSKSQPVVARSSGEAETVALRDAVLYNASANRALCAGGLPAQDFFEKVLGRTIPLHIYVDATTCKRAAEKGVSKQMRYLSKTQQVDLFWLRDVVSLPDIHLEKVNTHDNIADIMTKPLDTSKLRKHRLSLGLHP